jgi:hypothetical protein
MGGLVGGWPIGHDRFKMVFVRVWRLGWWICWNGWRLDFCTSCGGLSPGLLDLEDFLGCGRSG